MRRSLLTDLAFALTLALSACAAPDTSPADPASDDDGVSDQDLTSNTALARKLQFDGMVYVSSGAAASTILDAVREQTQSAFGALRTANVGVNNRELKAVDPRTFKKESVTVVDTAGKAKAMTRVRYRYTDTAVVPKTMATRSALQLALLGANYDQQGKRVLVECTDNDKEAKEFSDTLWYVFNPSLAGCRTAVSAEQKAIDADRAKLADAKKVPASEVSRLYLPVTVALTGDKTNHAASYPEYHRLYAGGVEKNTVVIGIVHGLLADWEAGSAPPPIVDDEGYHAWFEEMRELFMVRKFHFAKIEPAEDLTTFTVGSTKVTGAKFEDLMRWELDGSGLPAGVSSSQLRALRIAVAAKVAKHWVTFESPVRVKIGSATARDVTLRINAYFGSDTDATPHKRAIKTSDVFIYDGHSYIGYGPLDPSRFSASDFPPSYQIFFIDGCVSYNYYEKDYLPLKSGGTKNLDLITNGLETYVDGSGAAMGRFVGALLNGEQESYSAILSTTALEMDAYDWGGDALRVVDGELDNTYDPAKKPIVVTDR